MRVRHVIRYYCDFCPRGYFKKPSMERHEKGCTANPNRVCGLCEYAVPKLEQKPIADLIACFGPKEVWDYTSTDEAMKKLRELAQGCPGCILAGIRKSARTRCGGFLVRGEEDKKQLYLDLCREVYGVQIGNDQRLVLRIGARGGVELDLAPVHLQASAGSA